MHLDLAVPACCTTEFLQWLLGGFLDAMRCVSTGKCCAVCCRHYRTLEEDQDERDPEGGLSPTTSGATAATAGGVAGGGGGGGNGELQGGGALNTVKSVELGPVADPRPRGITTPQKLQRTVSNSTEESAAVLGSTPTPRAAVNAGQGPLRNQPSWQGP